MSAAIGSRDFGLPTRALPAPHTRARKDAAYFAAFVWSAWHITQSMCPCWFQLIAF